MRPAGDSSAQGERRHAARTNRPCPRRLTFRSLRRTRPLASARRESASNENLGRPFRRRHRSAAAARSAKTWAARPDRSSRNLRRRPASVLDTPPAHPEVAAPGLHSPHGNRDIESWSPPDRREHTTAIHRDNNESQTPPAWVVMLSLALVLEWVPRRQLVQEREREP